MAESKAAFRRRLGRLLNILTTATLNGTGSTTSFVATSLIDKFTQDSTLNGAYVYDVAQAEGRTVSAWLASTGTGTVSRAFTRSQASGRSIEVYEQFSPTALDDGLRAALVEAYQYVSIDIVDESNDVEADTYEYPVASIIRDMSRAAGGKVSISPNPDVETWPRVEITDWTVRFDGEEQTLLFPRISGLIGKTIRIEAKGAPGYPSSDTALIPLRDDTLQLLAFKAAEIVWRTGPGLSGKDADFAATQESKWQAMFDAKRDEWGTLLHPTQWRNNNDTPIRDYPLAYFHKGPE